MRICLTYYTQRRYKGRVSNMMEIMGEIISSEVDNLDPDMVDAFFEMDSVYEDNMVPMYVATNSKKVKRELSKYVKL